jgi:hypothetical protein
MIIGYSKLHTYLSLSNRGLKPLLQKLDNEVPASLKKYIQQNEVNFQLVPPSSMDKMQQNEPSDVLKTTSSWVLAAQTKSGPRISGADFYHNVQQLSTYYATRRSTSNSLHIRSSTSHDPHMPMPPAAHTPLLTLFHTMRKKLRRCTCTGMCTHTGTHIITIHVPPSYNPATMPPVSPKFNDPQPGQLRH